MLRVHYNINFVRTVLKIFVIALRCASKERQTEIKLHKFQYTLDILFKNTNDGVFIKRFKHKNS